MSESVTIHLPDDLARQAHAVAARTQRPVEEVLLDWLGWGVAEMPVDLLSDEQVLAAADSQLDEREQDELSELLARQRDGELDASGRERLATLLRSYRSGMTRKAQAMAIAVARELRPGRN
jgi:hypothetical protein